jgi:tRNA(Arg) A34 adenosine deaminase TadA
MITKTRLQKLHEYGKRESLKSNYKFQIGAVIFQKNQIISSGYSKDKTHPIPVKYFRYGTIHAEIDAILKIHKDKLVGSSMFVYRQLKNGQPAMAKSCPMCVQVMKEFGVHYIYWTTDDFPYWDFDTVDNIVKQIDPEHSFEYNRYN